MTRTRTQMTFCDTQEIREDVVGLVFSAIVGTILGILLSSLYQQVVEFRYRNEILEILAPMFWCLVAVFASAGICSFFGEIFEEIMGSEPDETGVLAFWSACISAFLINGTIWQAALCGFVVGIE